MLIAFQVWSWSQIFLVAQGVLFVVLLVVAVFYALKLGSTKAWKETAEQRKEAIADMAGSLVRLRERLEEKSRECEHLEREQRRAERQLAEASHLNFELQGRVRKYERLHGRLSEDSDS